MAGGTSERMIHHLVWERTENVNGGKRKNIPKDLHCEHLNMQYKENSRDAGGQLTLNTVNRHSQMLGIGKKTFRVSSMTKLFSSLTIQESMGILTEKRTFVEWLRLCNHSIILVRKKE